MGDDMKPAFLTGGECQAVQEQLEERLIEDASPQEEGGDAVKGHLARCGDCADFVKIATHLRDLAPKMADAKSDLTVRSALNAYFERRRRRKRIALAWVAVAAVAALILALDPLNFGESDTDEASATRLAAGKRFETLEGRITLSLSKNAWARTVFMERDAMQVRLDRGLLCAHVEPEPNRRVHFSVLTPSGVVEVKGTMFAVEVMGHDVRLDVVRGEVEAGPLPTEKGHAISVRAGSSFDFKTRKTMKMREPLISRIHSMLKVTPPTKDQTVADPALPMPADGADKGASADDAKSIAPLESPGRVDQRAPHLSPKALLDAARECRTAQNWPCAANHYSRVVKQFPDHPEAATALITLAQIQLRHFHQAENAKRNFERYQKLKPSGPLAEEALYGIASAQRMIGNRSEEERSLEQFLTLHPSSPLTGEARQRLNALKKGSE